ncbi:MAG: O-acetylhomoserine aminocarboxypropyltransferase/cysteine synthase [Chitinispirillia bacterium]|nr:O-acetylhomoserine aminocarboxypropyltransferase/cysteine synthase [Chitinispirillia bacterium]MCL2267629.1 O-acetylhomoserine aminocarboxypropyltransferase/cysteine synthase [Chitinispirillia bacterium]
MSEKSSYKFETLQLHAGQEVPDPVTGSRTVPIYATTAYVFKDCAQAAARFSLTEGGNIYTRLMNPTTDVFEQRVAALEGGVAAIATASGMAALAYAVQNITVAGQNIVSDRRIYGGSYNLLAHTLPDCGIKTAFVDGSDPKNFKDAIDGNTRALFVEMLSNPNSTIIDIEAIAKIAHDAGIPLIVDNTFATPYLFRPFDHGADIVIHSATKFLGGHSTVMGGVVVDGGKFDWKRNDKFPGLTKPTDSYHGVVMADLAGPAAFAVKIRVTLMRDTGATISPFNSFLMLQGLETLSLRMERHTQNALNVIDFLAKHPKVESVNHPSVKTRQDNALYKRYYPGGAGSIFTFEVKGGVEEARRFCEALKLFSLVANVGDMKSLVTHPASMTHSQLNERELAEQEIKPNTVRLSIGTEHIDDIIADLDRALSAS